MKTCVQVLFLVLLAYTPVEAQTSNTSFYLPALQAVNGSELGIALSNPTAASISAMLTARDYDGTLLAGPDITNPANIVIPPSGQRANLTVEIFGSGIGGKSGWIELKSSSSSLKGFYLVFDDKVTYIDGAELQSTPAIRLIFPKVQSSTIIGFAYTGSISTEASIGLYKNDGTLFARKMVSLSSHSGFSASVTAVAPSATSFVGYAIVEVLGVPDGLIGFETYPGLSDIAAVSGIADTSIQKTGYLAYLATRAGYTSTLSLVNPTPQPQSVTISAAGLEVNGTSRNPASVSVNRTIPAFGRLEETADQLFSLSGDALISGYIRWDVQGSTSGVIGVLDYGTTDGVVLSAVTAPAAALKDIYFSHIAEGQGYYTGLDFLNPGTSAATVTVEAFNASGVSLGKTTLPVNGGGRTAKLIRELIPQITNQLGGYVHVTATLPIFSLELFGSTSFTFLANVSGQEGSVSQPGTMPTGSALQPFLVSLSSYSADKGSTVTLDVNGSGFTSNSVVLIDSVSLPTTFLSSTSLRVTYTASASGVHLVAVWTPGGGISNSGRFSVNGQSTQPTPVKISPIGISIGQTNVPFTIDGTDLGSITGVTFLLNGSPDPGISVSSFQADPSGTRITFAVSVTDGATTGGHSISLTGPGFQFFAGNITVSKAGAPVVYSITPDHGDLGNTVTITITGSGLTGISAISLNGGFTGSQDSAITIENLSASDNSITADLVINRSAMIGPHPVSLGTGGNLGLASGIFFVQADGLLISNPATINLTQAAAPKTVTFNGTGLDAATGFDFITPSGDIDGKIGVSGFTARTNSITATLTAAADGPIGPRFIIVRARGTGFTTVTTVVVATPSGIAPTGTLGQVSVGGTGTISLFRNSSWNITGLKFQKNGIDDNSIAVTNFQLGPSSMSATVSVSESAAPGPRTLVLLVDGTALRTTILFTVVGRISDVLITSSSPVGATAGQGSVPLTIRGPNLSGITKIEFAPCSGFEFATCSGVDAGIIVSDISVSPDGKEIDAIMTISSNTVTGFHQLQTGSGSQTFGTIGSPGLFVYAAGAIALYSVTPDTGEVGQSIAGFKATGAGLTGLTTVFGFEIHLPSGTIRFSPTSFVGNAQNALKLQNVVSTANTIQGTLSIGTDAWIGRWGASLQRTICLQVPLPNSATALCNPNKNPINVYSAPFNVTQNGVSVTDFAINQLRRGDSGVAFTISGENLASVSGVEFLNSDGSKDTQIAASDIVATDTSIRGSLAADGGAPTGLRLIILDFNDGTSLRTVLNFAVQ